MYARALKLFDTATGQEKWSIPITDKNASVSVGAFSRDGRVIFGTMQVFDGPFMESKEHVGGFAMIEVPDLDEAIRIAKAFPGGVEVRPIVVH